ncbi:MAG: LapA family protein [Rubrivivax sp.]|nr:LapA family protein [Rubrivivax sp.]
MRLIAWLVRAFLFFALFAFALNNQHEVAVHGFFGLEWRSPLVVVVLLAFATGALLGVLAMLPGWWRARRALAPPGHAAAADSRPHAAAGATTRPPAPDSTAEYPPRVGL